MRQNEYWLFSPQVSDPLAMRVVLVAKVKLFEGSALTALV